MEEITRRRMLWIALVASAGFFLGTMLVAAAGALNAGWYLLGAVVYAAVLLLAVIGFLTERGPETVAPAQPIVLQTVQAAPPAPAPAAEPQPVFVQERVVYTTKSGQVLEVSHTADGETTRDFDIEHGAHRTGLADAASRIEALGHAPGEPPGPGELRAALLRWGHIREVN